MAARLQPKISRDLDDVSFHPSFQSSSRMTQSIVPSWFPLLLTMVQDYCVLQVTHLHLQNLLLFQFYQTCLPKKYQPCTMCMFHHFGLLRYAIQQWTLPYKVEECLAVVLGTSGTALGVCSNTRLGCESVASICSWT